MRDLIHFAHGNGFPALCYKQMLDQLYTKYDYCYIDRIGHNPLYPVGENWHNLVAELIDSIEKQANQPVIAVGHSLGGILSLLASFERPELFKAVVMLDSPIIGRFKSTMVKLAKNLGVIDRVTPAFRTRGRRKHWQNEDQLNRYLRSRDLFKSFSAECLQDYITYGLELKDDGYHLRFDSHTEYHIYRTIPHNLPKFEGKLLVPAALLYGDKSTVVDRMDVRYMTNYFNMPCHKIHGSHLFPMEHPKYVANQIIDTLNAIIK